jgi:hypothetical protein
MQRELKLFSRRIVIILRVRKGAFVTQKEKHKEQKAELHGVTDAMLPSSA